MSGDNYNRCDCNKKCKCGRRRSRHDHKSSCNSASHQHYGCHGRYDHGGHRCSNQDNHQSGNCNCSSSYVPRAYKCHHPDKKDYYPDKKSYDGQSQNSGKPVSILQQITIGQTSSTGNYGAIAAMYSSQPSSTSTSLSSTSSGTPTPSVSSFLLSPIITTLTTSPTLTSLSVGKSSVQNMLAKGEFLKLCRQGIPGDTIFADDFRIQTSEFLRSVFDQTDPSRGIFPAFLATSNYGGSAWFDPPDVKVPDGVTHTEGKLTVTNSVLDDKWKGVNIALTPNFGVRGNDKIRIRMVSDSTFDLPASHPYDPMVVHPGGLEKDVRFVATGLIVTMTPGVKTICFFLTKTAAWAFSDSGADLTGSINPSGGTRGWAYGHKVADIDTSQPHFYEMEYDRGKDTFRWFLDGKLVFTNSTPGLQPTVNDGDVITDRGDPVQFLEKFDNFALNVVSGIIFGQMALAPSIIGLEEVESLTAATPPGHFKLPKVGDNLFTERNKTIKRDAQLNLRCMTVKRNSGIGTV